MLSLTYGYGWPLDYQSQEYVIKRSQEMSVRVRFTVARAE